MAFTDLLPACDACDGPADYLGRLGRLDWWRCRDCGLILNAPADDDRAADDET